MTRKNNDTVDGDPIHWEEHISERGEKYKVGLLKEGNLHETARLDAGIPLKPTRIPFNVEVNWPVGSSKDTDVAFQLKTGISEYELYKISTFYKYELSFTNLAHYNYHFTDETGDRYLVKTYVNRTHRLQYNSRKPTIIRIEGK